MKDIVKVLKPTLLTGIILLLMLLAQAMFCSSTTYSATEMTAMKSTSGLATTTKSNGSASQPATMTDSNISGGKSAAKPRGSIVMGSTCSSYGMGAPIRVTHNEATTVAIDWIALSVNLTLCYIIAALVSLMLKEATGFRRPALAYGGVTVLMVAASFCVALGLSKYCWGTFFRLIRF